MSETLFQYCIRTGRTELLLEWNYKQNLPLTPSTVTHGAKKKVWWMCHQGHEWQARIDSRTSGNHNCPYCSGRYTLTGVNDLVTLEPELAAEWHPIKNKTLLPTQVTPFSHKVVWWCCENGHVWQQGVGKRVESGRMCPICTHRIIIPGINDLATEHPEIAREWHLTKNKSLTPSDVGPNSRLKVWWQCAKGHEWKARIAARTKEKGTGCPICSGAQVLAGFNDLKTICPEIAAEWYQDLNKDLTPDQVTYGSNRKVWWQCTEGHVWEARISSRTGPQKTGCPVCASSSQQKRNKLSSYYIESSLFASKKSNILGQETGSLHHELDHRFCDRKISG